jgi:hypothetical protein
MGRKSSAKAQGRDSAQSSGQGTPPPRSSLAVLAPVMVIAAVAIVGALAYLRSGHDATAGAAAGVAPGMADHAQATSGTQVSAEPRWAKLGPHKQTNLPPLPTQEYAPPRPVDVVRSAYLFAAEHPEILSYVPCFCGCERGGHRGNEDCFVAARDAKGDVTQWEPHGLECTVCIDVATEARQMFASGASVRDIRAAVEKKWAGFNGGHTPTPPAPPRSE